MNITLHTFLVVCPLVFLAGLVDAIGGGGGLISLPAFLIAGLPPHAAIATNKISSPFGTAGSACGSRCDLRFFHRCTDLPSRPGTHSFLCINGNPSGICISRIKQEII